MIRINSLIWLISFFCIVNGSAQENPEASYYDFWIGEWHQVTADTVAENPGFVIEKGLFDGHLVEEWVMTDQTRAVAWRTWDSSTGSWQFVWVHQDGLFQIWEERKIGDHWYMHKTFVVDGQEIYSRQAFIPQEDGSVVRSSEHSKDGGATWQLRFRERYVKK